MDNHSGAVVDEISFSINFPLPYRVLTLGIIGILGWATNLHGLNLLGIDAATALELSTRHDRGTQPTSLPESPTTHLPTHNGWKLVTHPSSIFKPVYKLFAQFGLVILASWALFRHASSGKLELVDMFKFIPAVTMIFLFMLVICPFDMFEKRERDKFL